MNPLDWLLEGTIAIGTGQLLVREIVGSGFGLASASFGMRRSVTAWPVGIAGNLILFTVFVGGVFAKPQAHDLWGQAGRQVFFLVVSVYGWMQWRQRRDAHETTDGTAIQPGWAGARGLGQLGVLALVCMAVFYPALQALGSYGPLSDAWILTGSILAYPSAVMYLAYGIFCAFGFAAWRRVTRVQQQRDRARTGQVSLI